MNRAQGPPNLATTKPATTGPARADPVWQGVLRFADGRTFVTDGGLAIDVTFAKSAKLPSREPQRRADAPPHDQSGPGRPVRARPTSLCVATEGGVHDEPTERLYQRHVKRGEATHWVDVNRYVECVAPGRGVRASAMNPCTVALRSSPRASLAKT
jgi:hypothetical protein